MSRLTLCEGQLTACLWPEAGGRIAALFHRKFGDLIVPMKNATFEPDFWPKAGAYPLIPFHNRVRKGRFLWEGVEYRLPLHPTEPNALHGFVSRRPWHATTEGNVARMVLEHEGDESWPWPLAAAQSVRLTETSLILGLSVTNRGKSTMPAGLGWHPFVPPCHIEEDGTLNWPLDENLLPLGHSKPRGKEGRTRYLSNWSVVTITLESGARMRLTASPLLSHLVVHEADGYACIEPVSHLAGALNSKFEGPRHGIVPLASGESLAGTISLELV